MVSRLQKNYALHFVIDENKQLINMLSINKYIIYISRRLDLCETSATDSVYSLKSDPIFILSFLLLK